LQGAQAPRCRGRRKLAVCNSSPTPLTPRQRGFEKKVTQSVMESGIRGTVAVVLAQAAQLDLFSLFHWDSVELLEAVRCATPVMLLDAALLLPSYGTLGRQLARRKPEPQALQQQQGQEQGQQQEQQQEGKAQEVWLPVQALGIWSNLQATSKALHEHQVFSRRCAASLQACCSRRMLRRRRRSSPGPGRPSPPPPARQAGGPRAAPRAARVASS
jgi:hypothetical protein